MRITPKTAPRSAAVTTAVVTVALLAGCSGPAPTTSASPTPPPSSSPTPTSTPAPTVALPDFAELQRLLGSYAEDPRVPPTISYALLDPEGLPETFRDETSPSPEGSLILRVACSVMPGDGPPEVTIEFSSETTAPVTVAAPCGESSDTGVVTVVTQGEPLPTGGVYSIVMSSERTAAVAVGFLGG